MYEEFIFDDLEDELMHVGVGHDENPPGRGSGRFPYGSGEHPNQRQPFSNPFIDKMRADGADDKAIVKALRDVGYGDVDIYRQLHKAGWTPTTIAKAMDTSTTKLRAKISIEKNREISEKTAICTEMHEEGLSNMEISRRTGLPEPTVRNLLKKSVERKTDALTDTAETLKEQLKEKKYLDIGPGTELYLGVTSTKLATAVAMLEEEGYKKYWVPVEQLGTGKTTTVSVLCPPGTKFPDVVKNKDEIKTVEDYIYEGEVKGKLGIRYPESVDSKRIMVRYAEEGGKEKDGVIELRRGVPDLSLGASQYAQVRIAVDGTHYLKGMAIYNDGKDWPDGVDIVFNTNKHVGTPLMDQDKKAEQVLKKMKLDQPDNPFGAAIKMKDGQIVGQRDYILPDGTKKLSPVNIVNEEGDWGEWSKTLASQMLSKQPLNTAKKQLNLALAEKKDEYNDYISLTNPTLKKKFLEEFADSCDSASVNLKAAALPRQQSHVILPVTSMKENEIYAPNYKDGTQVVLIRYPHAGQFEIPQLKVNNKQPEAKSFMFNAKDAVGINAKVAEQLSGADFDGDTVLVIPVISASGKRLADVRSQKPYQELVDFDPKEQFKGYKGIPDMPDQTKQREMGIVSNLITDMNIKGASKEEMIRAVKHSMVVIDAQKHHLDYKASEKAFDIAGLKKIYQDNGNGKHGASTLISRAKSEARVDVRKLKYAPDPVTGEKVYEVTPKTRTIKKTNKDGTVIFKEVPVLMKSTQMAETKDARTLMSGPDHEGWPIERAYAAYANELKALANKARLEAYNTKGLKYDPSAKKVYISEVESLNRKLEEAKRNAPRERQAQIIGGEIFKAQLRDNPDMDKEHQKKVKSQALANARTLAGAKKQKIDITEAEWKAIQSGAITDNVLRQILDNADDKKLKEYALPRQTNGLSDAKKARIKSMHNSGFTTADIAETIGISTSAVSKALSD